jgi:uncharacterized membrane protein SpoIIM required for sporulation
MGKPNVKSYRFTCDHAGRHGALVCRFVDIDVFVAQHRGSWERLEKLVARAERPSRLSGADVDELIELYQRTATHLSVIQSRSPDAHLISRLSVLTARARAAITGAHDPAWSDFSRFFVVTFPAALYRTARWWASTALASLAVTTAVAVWITTHPHVIDTLVPPAAVRQLVTHDFKHYYSAHPATDFAANVWTHNALIAAGTLALGVFLGVPTLLLLWGNCVNIGVDAGVMAANGKLAEFFGLILPHGLLELTAVFIAAGTGLRIGWTLIEPGPRTRSDALAQEGRASFSIALGLVAVLMVSGVIEAFVTPSPLPTWVRVSIGVIVESAFIAYVVVFGSRAVRAGETGDLDAALRADTIEAAG